MTICPINDIRAAFEAAKSAGHQFRCSDADLTFNSRNQIGCKAELGAGETVRRVRIDFFTKQGGYKKLKNGWMLHDHGFTGGYMNVPVHERRGSSLIKAGFQVRSDQGGAGSRYLSKLVLKKEHGDCRNVLKEAF